MKSLSSLTTFFITFLFVVYLGVFTGLKINSFISGKQLVAVTATPSASVATQPTPKPSLVILTQATPSKAPVQTLTTQTTAAAPNPVSTTIPATTAAPIVDTSTPPPPVPSVDTGTPPPAPPAPAPSVPPPDPRCIITVSGGQYDVTDFRNIHSGGDVFKCGTDMTASFLSQHPASYLQKMAKYRV